jgi:hypothetical protein
MALDDLGLCCGRSFFVLFFILLLKVLLLFYLIILDNRYWCLSVFAVGRWGGSLGRSRRLRIRSGIRLALLFGWWSF